MADYNDGEPAEVMPIAAVDPAAPGMDYTAYTAQLIDELVQYAGIPPHLFGDDVGSNYSGTRAAFAAWNAAHGRSD